MLLSGQSHRMDADAIVHASGFGPARYPCSMATPDERDAALPP